MIELKNNGKLTFVIPIRWHMGEVLTGGVVAVHMLAYKLAERGHIVYMFADPEYPHKNIHQIPFKNLDQYRYEWEPFTFNTQKTVVIYSQIEHGNALGIPNVARWLMYHSEKILEDMWDKNDYVFNYMSFETHHFPIEGTLTTADFHLDTLYNKNLDNRKGFCHIIHKDTPNNYQDILRIFKSTDIGDWKSKGTWDYLQQVFNEHKYFLTFDNNSFYTITAGLCGCIPIVLNDTKYSSPEEFREKNPLFQYGIAYGMNDIDWALNTHHLLLQNINLMDREYNKSVDNFIKFWEDKLNS